LISGRVTPLMSCDAVQRWQGSKGKGNDQPNVPGGRSPLIDGGSDGEERARGGEARRGRVHCTRDRWSVTLDRLPGHPRVGWRGATRGGEGRTCLEQDRDGNLTCVVETRVGDAEHQARVDRGHMGYAVELSNSRNTKRCPRTVTRRSTVPHRVRESKSTLGRCVC
jgi:hypothetical protein